MLINLVMMTDLAFTSPKFLFKMKHNIKFPQKICDPVFKKMSHRCVLGKLLGEFCKILWKTLAEVTSSAISAFRVLFCFRLSRDLCFERSLLSTFNNEEINN